MIRRRKIRFRPDHAEEEGKFKADPERRRRETDGRTDNRRRHIREIAKGGERERAKGEKEERKRERERRIRMYGERENRIIGSRNEMR